MNGITIKVKLLLILSILSVSIVFPQSNSRLDNKTTRYKDYESDWRIVDSLELEGLPKSAKPYVDIIYNKAKNDNNVPQVIKALLVKFTYLGITEENSEKKIINEIKEEIKKSKGIIQNLLYSILADVYWQYLQRNRYRYYNRTDVINSKEEDIDTWSLPKLINEIIKQYRSALQNIEEAKSISVSNISDIITGLDATNKKLRPTVYDLISQKALDFFSNSESALTEPSYKFELNNSDDFSPSENFIKINYSTKDTLSLKFYAVNIFQELLRFHASDKDLSAYLDIDLQRLSFMQKYSVHSLKDSMYISALEKMAEKYKDSDYSGNILFNAANYYAAQGILYTQGYVECKEYLKKAAHFCYLAMIKYPGSYGASQCRLLKKTIDQKRFTFVAEHASLPEEPFKFLLRYKNIDKIYISILKHDPKCIGDFDSVYINYRLNDKYKFVKQLSFSLPIDPDYNDHSVELPLPSLPVGEYVILASDDSTSICENYTSDVYQRIFITNLSFISQDDYHSKTILVLDRKTGLPIGNVKAKFYTAQYNALKRSNDYNLIDSSYSNKEGYITQDYQGSYRIVLEKGDDRFLTDEYFNNYHPYKPRNTATQFFLDRMIYRPGQTVYFKGITFYTDENYESNIVKGEETVVIASNPNNQEIKKLILKTNEYGTFEGTIEIPANTITGNFTLSCNHGRIWFRAEEYKRPKFEVALNPVKGEYKINETVTITGSAKTYSGINLDNAKVKYTVKRTANYPYNYWYYTSAPGSNEMQITSGETTTGTDGKFSFNFTAIPDLTQKKYNAYFTYRVTVDVVDATGETHTTTTSISAGFVSLVIKNNLPGVVNKNNPLNLSIRTENLNNQFEKATVSIKIQKLIEPSRIFRNRQWEKPDEYLLSKEEFYKLFEHDIYSKEDRFTSWEKENPVLDTTFITSDSSSLNFAKVSNLKQGKYLLLIDSKDKSGNSVKTENLFTIIDLNSKVNAINNSFYYLPIKCTAEPGEKAQILIGSAENNVHVLYEIEYKNGDIEKKTIILNKEQKLIEIPIKEKDRGNIYVHFSLVINNEGFSPTIPINVLWNNKTLEVSYETFRNKLIPGSDEEWKIKLNTFKKEKADAEVLASMYDESLDALTGNSWQYNFISNYQSRYKWQNRSFSCVNPGICNFHQYHYESIPSIKYYHLENFGFDLYNHYYQYNRVMKSKAGNAGRIFKAADGNRASRDADGNIVITAQSSGQLAAINQQWSTTQSKPSMENSAETVVAQSSGTSLKFMQGSSDKGTFLDSVINNFKIIPRKLLKETAFFYPQLHTNDDGEVIISFKAPEALTRWKFRGLAHTKNLEYCYFEKEVVTQKVLMVQPNPPRFLREGDTIFFSAKISNLSDKDIAGKATLELFDAFTMKPIDIEFYNVDKQQKFTINKERSTTIFWKLIIPPGKAQSIVYRVSAVSEKFTDGEENSLPVLPNRMLVVETLPLPVKSKETKQFVLEKLRSNISSTLRNYKLTLEFTSNPAWYAVQALPYLMEFPHECYEQIFSRYYANSIAMHIAESSPKIKDVFEKWKNIDTSALLSNLEKNQDLKNILLNETPWVMDSKDESERKKRIGELFDYIKMSREMSIAINKLLEGQHSDGGWSWFPGMQESPYITTYLVSGFGHLDRLNIKNIRLDQKLNLAISKAVHYIDQSMNEYYNNMVVNHIDMYSDHLNYSVIQYLYARSFFKDIPLNFNCDKAFTYFKDQAKQYWLTKNTYMQGMIALALKRFDGNETAVDIVKSLKENAVYNDELGMYFKRDYGWYWWQAPIETQALMIEAFDEVAYDHESVELMKVWLLKQKQTHDWGTTTATAEACYALLLRGKDLLSEDKLPVINVGDVIVDPGNTIVSDSKKTDIDPEAGTGYFKTSWDGDKVTPNMGNITVANKNNTIAWGSMYWQYFEQLDKITPAQSPLKVEKKLFIETITATGPKLDEIINTSHILPGDQIKVRIILKVDRDMEFVHMKDMRAAGFEPINVLSLYKQQDGLGYYESTRDAATNFFFDYLRKGTYVFEYPLRAVHKGEFSNGITTVQCMYAPEFSAHSEGLRIKIQ